MAFVEVYNKYSDYSKVYSLFSLLKLESPQLRVKSLFYLSLSSASSCSISCWVLEEANPIRHFFPYFLIMKEVFWGVLTIQAYHSSFNLNDIRQEHLINVKVTIVLSSVSFFLCLQQQFCAELLSSVILFILHRWKFPRITSESIQSHHMTSQVLEPITLRFVFGPSLCSNGPSLTHEPPSGDAPYNKQSIQ